MTLLAGLPSCTPPSESERIPTFNLDFSDTSFARLWYAQTRQDTQMIESYLSSSDPMRQYAALMALSTSPADRWAIPLLELLKAPQKEIQTLAAYSLGQLENPSVLPELKQAFDNDDSLMQRQHFNATILEAVGKLGGPREAIEMITTKTYAPRDSILNLGRLRGLYHIAQNGHELEEVKYFMLDVIAQSLYPSVAHYLAADYLARFNTQALDSLQFGLIRAFERSSDTLLKRQLARSLPYCTASRAQELLAENFSDPKADPIVRLLCGQGLLMRQPKQPSRFFKTLLDDRDARVSRLAASYFYKYGNQHDALDYAEWARNTAYPKSTQFVLFSAARKHLPFYYELSKNKITNEMLAFWPQEMDRSERNILIRYLVLSSDFFGELISLASSEKSGIVRSDILRAIQKQYCERANCDFSRKQTKQIIPLLETSLKGETNEQTVAAELAAQLGTAQSASWSTDTTFIRGIYQSLKWPRQLEAGRALEVLMDSLAHPYVKRGAIAPVRPYARIWQQLTDSTRVVVQLDHGEIRIALRPQVAPLTVAQLIAEVESGYYDGKAWHRVVPNFVVQTGCPTGHGYDSGDFLLPTETSPYAHYYSAGSCGMASIGPHTESTQWFISLRATPHLDGRYTKWGDVVSGLELLDQIKAGSIIQSMYLENLSL